MGSNTVNNGQVTNANVDEEKVINAALVAGRKVRLKAPKTNVKVVFIGKQGASRASTGGYPLDPGESVELEVSNAKNLFYSLEGANEKLNWLTLGA